MLKPIDENVLLASPRFTKQKEYWMRKFAADIVFTEIRPDMSQVNPGLQKEKAQIAVCLPRRVCRRLIKFSKASDLSLYIVLLTSVKLLIYFYTGNEDIGVLSPLYRPRINHETINHCLLIRNCIWEDLTFVEGVLKVRQSVLQAYENQDYPFNKLIEYLFDGAAARNGRPSSISCSLTNIHPEGNIRALEGKLQFIFRKEQELIKVDMLYDAASYSGTYSQRLVNHLVNILEHALEDVNIKISDISILSREEKKQLLWDFNDTRADIPTGKTIHQLFEEQVEGSPGHTALVGTAEDSLGGSSQHGPEITYGALNEKANQLAQVLRDKGITAETIVAVLLDRSIELITALLAVLKAGGAYLPIDIEYPADRINYLLEDSHTKLLLTGATFGDKVKFAGPVIDAGDARLYRGKGSNLQPLSCADNLVYVIYTSGTTGKPKGVMIEHRAVVNYVWWAAKTYVYSEKNNGETINFPLYSSISFDLTVTSIFTPLITGNAIVVYKGTEKEFLIEQIIEENRVRVVKLTPSHLSVIKYMSIDQSGIRCFIVGGEELETKIAREIDTRFGGNVKIYNEYGPTEAAVGCVYYRFNPAADNGRSVPIGVPTDNVRIYLLDRTRKPVPMGVPGEIYISGDSLARGYLDSVELTAEKFGRWQLPPLETWAVSHGAGSHPGTTSGVKETHRLYRSGDLARWLPKGNLEYLGRMDQQVKIRGYRIELGEIEQQLLKHDDIKEAKVIVRDGREGGRGDEKGDPYLCAYFVSNSDLRASQLREYLQQHLPDYMIPSFFVGLEEIPLTSNGKVDRKALPGPGINLEQEYVGPRNEIEAKLAAIWSEVLGIKNNKIGIDSNFFRLGGHSIKGMILAANIHKELNVKLPLAELFKYPTIRELSENKMGIAKEEFLSVTPTEKKEYYQLSPSQERLFIIHQIDPDNINFNLPRIFLIKGDIDTEKLERTFTGLIARHESLRTSFELAAENPIQRVYDNVNFEIEYDNQQTGAQNTTAEPGKETIEKIIGEFIRPFALNQVPLLRVRLVKIAGLNRIFLIDMHHIITDAVSLNLLTNAFKLLYAGRELPPLRLQYRDYSEWWHHYKVKKAIKKQEDYWLNKFREGIPLLSIPTDYPRPDIQDFAGSALDFILDSEETKALKEIGLRENTTLFIVLLTIFIIFLSKLSKQQEIILGTAVSNRNHADLEKIIGFFINLVVLRCYPLGEKVFSEFLREVIQETLEVFENQDYPFESLVDKVAKNRDVSRHPICDVGFTFENAPEQPTTQHQNEIADLNLTPYASETRISNQDFTLLGFELQNQLEFTFVYCTKLFEKETILDFIDTFKKIVSTVIEYPGKSLKDIEIISMDEKNKVLSEIRKARQSVQVEFDIE